MQNTNRLFLVLILSLMFISCGTNNELTKFAGSVLTPGQEGLCEIYIHSDSRPLKEDIIKKLAVFIDENLLKNIRVTYSSSAMPYSFACYDSERPTIVLKSKKAALDTIAHEIWHISQARELGGRSRFLKQYNQESLGALSPKGFPGSLEWQSGVFGSVFRCINDDPDNFVFIPKDVALTSIHRLSLSMGRFDYDSDFFSITISQAGILIIDEANNVYETFSPIDYRAEFKRILSDSFWHPR
jgi:hypothetical protein